MTIFNPLEVSEELKRLYKNFILSSFPIADASLKRNIEKLIDEEKLLWNGPFVSIATKYKRGDNAKKFLQHNDFHPLIVQLLQLDKFYKHQEEAIESILQNKHTIISTGTGSGKTEAFLLPILDYCLKNRQKGIKAIIVYPMNALANDQMLRLRTFLYKINSTLSDPITFCRYTAQTPQEENEEELRKIPYQRCQVDKTIMGSFSISGCPPDCDKLKLRPELREGRVRLTCSVNPNYRNDFEIITRKEIRDNPPDILITNYVELEYLLLRREDAKLFQSPCMKFLVFDEVHWYSGATGAEVALLIRRLKTRIKKYSQEKLICIGTSATISSAPKAREEIARFVSQLFGETISPECIVVGEKERLTLKGGQTPSKIDAAPIYTPHELCNMSEEKFEDFCKYFSDVDLKIPYNEERLAYLGEVLSKNEIFKDIVNEIYEKPKSIEDICKDLSTRDKLSSLPPEKIEGVVWSYLYAGSVAYDPTLYERGEKEPLIRPQVHLFFKTLGEQWPFGEIFVCVKCGELYTKPHEKCVKCGGSVEELGICRFCGEVFYRAVFEQNPLDSSLRVKSTIGRDPTIDSKKLNYNEDDYYRIWQVFENPEDKKFVEQKKCLDCGSLSSKQKINCQFCDSNNLYTIFLRDKIPTCPFCGRSYGGRSEAVSPVYISPNTTSKLVFDLNYILLPEGKRKMLVFSDSRQDASYMAGTIDDEHLTHMLRQIITQVVWQYQDLTYQKLEEIILNKIQSMDPSVSEDKIEQKLLIEISSVAARQRSPENLGLISVEYTNIRSIDVSSISAKFGISDDVFKKYLITILNEIRQDGALEGLHNFRIGKHFPTGIVCIRGGKRGEFTKNLLGPRGGFINYTKKVFQNQNPTEILEKAFELLKKYGYLKEVRVGFKHRNSENGFVIAKDKIRVKIPTELYLCNVCGRVYTNTPNEICPGWRCDGKLIKKTPEEYYSTIGKFHIMFYKEVEPVKLKVEEDTGYIPIEKRQELELGFRSGNIDLLVATPTLELGIDIGDLVCIGLMKSPPSPANYAQRVGRAGRESGVSMATSFMFQNPIDRYYFDSPQELISGEILAPSLNLNNPYIVRRHIHSLILEELLVTPSSAPPYYIKLMREFVKNNCLDALLDDLRKYSDRIVTMIKSTFGDIQLQGDLEPNKVIKDFPNSFKRAVDFYRRELEVLEEILKKIREQQDTVIGERTYQKAKAELELLTRMERNINHRRVDLNQREFFSHLSVAGMTPRYAFPGRAVRVISLDGKEYAERQMPIALYELAPGMPVYLGGKKNKVIGLPFGQEPEMMHTTTFYVCNNCKIYAQESVSFDKCPECGVSHNAIEIRDCYRPTAVVVKEEGKPSEEGRESVYVEAESYLLQPITAVPTELSSLSKETPLGKIKLLDRWSIVTIVEGIREYTDTEPKRFTLCGNCGYYLGGKFSDVRNEQEKKHLDLSGREWHQPSDILRDIKLYHKFDTTVLLLTLHTNDRNFLITLKNALINAAQRIVGADDGEIDGIIKDNNLILYDNVEGGAGYVNTIFDKFDQVLEEARNLILRCDCERGCPKCLYSYRRRRDIREIDKRILIDFFKTLHRAQVEQNINEKGLEISNEKDIEAKISQLTTLERSKAEIIPKEFKFSGEAKCILSNVGSSDGATEVRDCILSANKSVTVVSLYISDMPVDWGDNKSFSWCDVLVSCKMNGVESVKVVVRPPKSDWERFALERLCRRGIEVYILDKLEGIEGVAHHKIVMIDEEMPSGLLILQSANLSPEVIKNADFYIFIGKKQNEAGYTAVRKWLESLINRCKKYEAGGIS